MTMHVVGLQNLPREVVDEIVDCLIRSFGVSIYMHDWSDKKFLLPLLGACPVLRRAVHRYIFRTVDVFYQSKGPGVNDAADPRERASKLVSVLTPEVLHHVRYVHISFGPGSLSHAHHDRPLILPHGDYQDSGIAPTQSQAGTEGTESDASSDHPGSDHSTRPGPDSESPSFKDLLRRLAQAPRVVGLSLKGYRFDFSAVNSSILYDYVLPLRLLPTLKDLVIRWEDCAHIPSPFLIGGPSDQLTSLHFYELRTWYHRKLGPLPSVMQLDQPTSALTQLTKLDTETPASLLFHLTQGFEKPIIVLPSLTTLHIEMEPDEAYQATMDILAACPRLRTLLISDNVRGNYSDPKVLLHQMLGSIGGLGYLEEFTFAYWDDIKNDVHPGNRSPLFVTAPVLKSLRCPDSLKYIRLLLYWTHDYEEKDENFKEFFAERGWELLKEFVAGLPETLKKLDIKLNFGRYRPYIFWDGSETSSESDWGEPVFEDGQTLGELVDSLVEQLPSRPSLELSCTYDLTDY